MGSQHPRNPQLCLLNPRKLNFYDRMVQRSKFTSTVSKCWSFCWDISPFYSICLSNKNAKAVKFLEIWKIVFLELKNKFFVKEKKISFIKKTFLQGKNYSCASIFIIHTFILYIFNSLLYLLCYALNEVIDAIHFFLSK